MKIRKHFAYIGTLVLPESDQECWCLSVRSDRSCDESLAIADGWNAIGMLHFEECERERCLIICAL